MFGSATLVIVESRVCINEAAITPATIKTNRSPDSVTLAYFELLASWAEAIDASFFPTPQRIPPRFV